MFRAHQTEKPYPAISTVQSQDKALDIQTMLIDEILRSKKIQFKKDEDPSVIVQTQLRRFWKQNIEMLALSRLEKSSAVYYREVCSRVMIATGKAISEVDPAFSQFAFIMDHGASLTKQYVQNYSDLAGKPVEFSSPAANIYIPIYYHSSTNPLSGRPLAKALNYFIGEKKWSVTLYLENDNDLQENLAKKNLWLNRNSDMLTQLGKKYGVVLVPNETQAVLTPDNLAGAEAVFLELLATHRSIMSALKKDVKKVLTPNKKSKVKFESDESEAYLAFWVSLLNDTTQNPNLSPEAKYKLFYFWYNVCNPPKAEKVANSPFSFFNSSQQQSTTVSAESSQEEGLHTFRASKMTIVRG
jgi:hypothetical protein